MARSALSSAASTDLVPCDVAAGYTRDAFSRRQVIGAVQSTGVLHITDLVILLLFGPRRVYCQSEPGLSTHIPVKPSVERFQRASPNSNLSTHTEHN